MKENFKIKLT